MYSSNCVEIRILFVLCMTVAIAGAITAAYNNEPSRNSADDINIWREMYMRLAARRGNRSPEGNRNRNVLDNTRVSADDVINELNAIYGVKTSLALDALVVNEQQSRDVRVDTSGGWRSAAASIQPEEHPRAQLMDNGGVMTDTLGREPQATRGKSHKVNDNGDTSENGHALENEKEVADAEVSTKRRAKNVRHC